MRAHNTQIETQVRKKSSKMVQNGLPIHASYILEEEGTMLTPATEGIPIEVPRNQESNAEQSVISLKNEIDLLR